FLQHKESATGNPSFLAADSIYWVTRTLRYPVAQPAQIERCNKRMANSLSNGHKSPRRQGSASCSSYCSLGTRWKESRTGCPAFLSKFIVIGGNEHLQPAQNRFQKTTYIKQKPATPCIDQTGPGLQFGNQ